MVVVTNASLLAALLRVLTGAPWSTLKLHLFQNNVSPGPTNVLADLTEATFDGYAAVTPGAFFTPYYDANGIATSDMPSQLFASTSPLTTPNVIYGYYLTDSGGTTLVYAERFANPISISLALQGIWVASQVQMGPMGQV